MDVATTPTKVGVRELKDHLSRYLAQVREGGEVVVTDRGRPIARLLAVDAPANRLADLVEQGLVRPASRPERRRPTRVVASGSVSELVAEQRR